MEQRGAYNDFLDLYISKDGLLEDIDKLRRRELAVDMRLYKRLKNELIEAGKIEVINGIITPLNAQLSLSKSLATSIAGQQAANSRWAKHKKINKKRDAIAMPLCYKSSKKKKDTPPKAPPKVENPRRKSNGKSPIPENWTPPDRAHQIGIAEGFNSNDVQWLAEQFQDSAIANARKYSDWDRAFYNWIRSPYSHTAIKTRNAGKEGEGNQGIFAILSHAGYDHGS
jgi:hypothetical protein